MKEEWKIAKQMIEKDPNNLSVDDKPIMNPPFIHKEKIPLV